MRAKEKKTYEQIIKQNEELCKQNALLKEQIEQLLERIKKLEKENQELKERLNKNSANSSKPPSSDGPRRSTKPKRQKSRHNNGGQPGHKGSCLKPVEKPDETIELTLEKSPAGAPLSQSDIIGWQRRQVFDIPEPRIEVTEYARAIYRCPHTGQKCHAAFPAEAGANVQYGPRIRALAIYFTHRQLIPLERTQEVLHHLYGMSPSQQTILKSCEKSHANLANFENQLKQRLLKEDLLHADETGARLHKKNHWIHVCCTRALTLIQAHSGRGREAFTDNGLLERYSGTLLHDCLGSYFNYGAYTHAICGAHLLRELEALREKGQFWARKLQILLRSACARIHKKGVFEKNDLARAQKIYHRILQEGFAMECNRLPPRKKNQPGRIKKPPGLNLLERLQKHQEAVLRFMHQAHVPFTNNQAERDIRWVKLQQKMSGCFRTPQGIRQSCRIRSYLSCLSKNSQPLLTGIQHSLTHNPNLQDILSIPTS